MRKICGIDPGISPALAFVTRPDKGNRCLRVPPAKDGSSCFDEAFMRAALVEEEPDEAVIELVGPMMGQGLASTAHFMTAWGLCRGLVAGLGIPYRLVTPSTWKRAVLAAYDLGDKAPDREVKRRIQKEAACQYVRDHYPGLVLVTKGRHKADDNMAEAVCLAAWGFDHG